MTNRPRLIGPKRRTVQSLLAILYFLPPWLFVGDSRVILFDLDHLTLSIVGKIFQLQDLRFLLFSAVIILLAGLLVTMTIGRVWCGWACPQTLLMDLVEAPTIRVKTWSGIIRHSLALLLGLACGLTLVWYFIPPDRFLNLLLNSALPGGAYLSAAIVTFFVYIDLAWIGRLVCKEFCPYGRIQAALADQTTLTLLYAEDDAYRCLRCNACVRTCPMKIDIRAGEQIACINCGRCLDACRIVMARVNQSGIIRYRFGSNITKLWRSPRLLMLTILLLIAVIILTVAIVRSTPFPFTISHTPGTLSRASGPEHYLNFFTLSLSNRQPTDLHAVLHGYTENGVEVTLQGPGRHLDLAPHEHLRTSFVAVIPFHPSATSERLSFKLLTNEGVVLSETHVLATPPISPQ